MVARSRRITVRAYNLRPGDVTVRYGHTVRSAIHYPGMWTEAFIDVQYAEVPVIDTFDADTLVTVTPHLRLTFFDWE